ncbi:MAG: XdhC family protein [Acidimicrobiia bacterium]
MVRPVPSEMRRLVDEERLGSVITIVSGPDAGAKSVIDDEKGYVLDSLPAEISEDVLADARELMRHEQNRTLTYGDRDVFIETIAPAPHLIILGAVHVAQPLVRMAKELGFVVTVSDARETFTTRERFPEADRILVGWPQDLMDDLEFDARTYVVILSHDARFEDPVFPVLHESKVRYIGAMGSRRTHRKRAERLSAAGWSDDEIARIHGPVGLDIGAEAPAEVAVSILAEMIQVRYGFGSGVSLRGREGRIHLQRTEDKGDL